MATKAHAERMGARRAFDLPGRGITLSLVIILLAALGGGVLIGRGTTSEAPSRSLASSELPAAPNIELADAATVEMIDALHEAASTDGERFASFFTEDGVFVEHTARDAVTRGRENIASLLDGFISDGWYVERVGRVARWGSFVAQADVGPEGYTGMAIYQLTPSGKISHMWVFGD